MKLCNLLLALCGFVIVSAQSHAAPRAPEAPVSSPLQSASEFSSCKWTRVAGARFSVSSFACGAEQGGIHLIADDTLPGFWLTGNDGGRELVIRLFTKAPKSQVSTALPAIRMVSKGPQTATCTLVNTPIDNRDQPGIKRYVLQPSGKALKAWYAAQDKGEAIEEPCGPLGVAMVGDRYFEVMPNHPDTVIFVNEGSEIQIFDPATVRVVARH